jgi:serine/threonine protein kinase
MGVVFRGRDEERDRAVAVKILPAGTFSNEKARRRFRREARVLVKLNHPNVAMTFRSKTPATRSTARLCESGTTWESGTAAAAFRVQKTLFVERCSAISSQLLCGVFILDREATRQK